MTTTAERLIGINEQIEAAAATVEADPGASPVLGAVVRELAHKAQKAVDIGASDTTRQAVVDAHLAICILKAKMT
jgi:hypothetical protein